MNGLLYPKTSAVDATNEYGDGDLRHVTPFTGGTNPSSGPTTMATRFYPKKASPTLNKSFNPQKIAVTKIYVGGID
jgi:hypothetical protein